MSLSVSGAARREFAQHWTIVLAAGLAIGVGMMGIGFYALGLFVAPVQAEFGWSRAAVSGAATFQQLGIFLSAPILGRLADRYGIRAIAIASYIAAPVALVLLSRAGSSVAMWWGLWLLVSLAGGGTTPAIWARAVSAKFDAGRGLALGLMLMGTGLAAFLAPALLGPVFAASGWRTAALVMAGTILVVGLPVSLLMPRDKKAKPETGTAKVRGRFEANRQTLTLIAIAILLGFFVAGLIVHMVPMVIDRGMAPAEAAQVAAKIGLAVIVARVLVGYLFDRFHAPFVAAFFLLSPVVAAVLLAYGGPVVVAALMLGLAAGAEVDMLAYFTGRYARIENYGATYGVVLGLFSFGAAFGPAAFGWSVDATGSYHFALIASALALALVVVLIATLGAYRDPVQLEPVIA
ncbi:MFS transporter [Novosphingobium profundi]|uniref:MFS transporter n=1 Tax=Novosphingobium profundi TaxID=1774954 RepID=UPI001BD9DC53|nr:MFS transporter [Novosphingobium profundi]MBT0667136.1 MFS transporter [Novosphingobium profundi]